MLRRIDKRYLVWGVAAIVLAAAFLLASAPFGDAAEDPVIDTGAPVSAEQCAPCHLNLASVSVPGLKFNHGNHLLVSCDGCHARMPHQDGSTERVPMEVCFACHGIQHGPQGELATSKCEDCHTKSFDLRPKDHTDDWAAKPHADAGKSQGVNGCMMCHSAPKDCDGCHAKEAPDVATMPDAYHTIIGPRPKGPAVNIFPKGEVSMSQCVYCHPDLDAITPGRLIFAHADHLVRNYSCDKCHGTFAHNEEGPIKPDMLSCYRCHGLEHADQGQVGTEECDKCHPKSFDLKPANHTKKFITKSHPDMAEKDPSYCAMCHKMDFCIKCHVGKGTGPYAPPKAVIPQDHTDAKWQGEHGKQFLAGDGLCGACHTGPSCQVCHKTVVPHTSAFINNHKPAPGVDANDCNICHRERQKCQNCHHGGVKNGELVRKNCVPCHEEAKQKPATAIQNKGIAEHAVHFDVAKKKGKPYKCYECHVDFGESASAQKLALQQGHDLRLCYSCHGNLDPFNVKIAPYPGASLCRRCHSDLNI